MSPGVPEFVEPMLARKGRPFDSDEFLFEIKWDGTRAQGRISGAGDYRLTNRRRRDLTDRYPEFDFLAGLEPGLLIDGEVVVLRQGKPDFGLLMSREQARNSLKIRTLSRSTPATLVAFDLLYRKGRSLMAEPLRDRREQLREIVGRCEESGLVLSDGVVGKGRDYFAAATAQRLEGVMAKRLASIYEPGKRSDAWLKIKQVHTVQCAIVGYLETGDELRSLIIATQIDGRLRCVGKVGSGMTVENRRRLAELVATRRRPTPWLECEIDGLWVEPGLYCTVSYLERTRAGHLRAPVFLELIIDE